MHPLSLLPILSNTTFLYIFILFFFNATAPPEIYTLSLHDALPICVGMGHVSAAAVPRVARLISDGVPVVVRSEEHTSELQSRGHLVCRLLLEKKKKKNISPA